MGLFALGAVMILADAAMHTIGRPVGEIRAELDEIRAGKAPPKKVSLARNGFKLARISFVSFVGFIVLGWIL
jgi:hypothetical protein